MNFKKVNFYGIEKIINYFYFITDLLFFLSAPWNPVVIRFAWFLLTSQQNTSSFVAFNPLTPQMP